MAKKRNHQKEPTRKNVEIFNELQNKLIDQFDLLKQADFLILVNFIDNDGKTIKSSIFPY